MKKFYIILCLIATTISSCIKDEAPNAEADILTCTVEDENILKQAPVITNTTITLWVKGTADVSQQALYFTLTPGATIEPENGTIRDFTEPQYYVVTSEDGKWHKTYKVSFAKQDITTEYHFENYYLEDKKKRYYIFEDENLTWASGNAGFAIGDFWGKLKPDEYPTYPGIGIGYQGDCLILKTRYVEFGSIMKMPIAAGNLFFGEFVSSKATTDPKGATRFGVPFNKVPQTLTGFYKYKRGPIFTDPNFEEVAGRKDIWNIYAVLYESEGLQDGYLTGHDILTSENIISKALISEEERMKEADNDEANGTTNTWKAFSIPFILEKGKTIDMEKLKADKYKLAIVLTSSAAGDEFLGAVDSELMVDELKLICTED